MGLILLLAGIGIRSGLHLRDDLWGQRQGEHLPGGALITTVTGLLMLLIGYKVLGISTTVCCLGMLAGMQTQPAVLGFATEQTENGDPNLGLHALVFPIATVTKEDSVRPVAVDVVAVVPPKTLGDAALPDLARESAHQWTESKRSPESEDRSRAGGDTQPETRGTSSGGRDSGNYGRRTARTGG
ncbi:MAG: hypothetical protein R3A10_02820 [Caldilineaceae bacterium]